MTMRRTNWRCTTLSSPFLRNSQKACSRSWEHPLQRRKVWHNGFRVGPQCVIFCCKIQYASVPKLFVIVTGYYCVDIPALPRSADTTALSTTTNGEDSTSSTPSAAERVHKTVVDKLERKKQQQLYFPSREEYEEYERKYELRRQRRCVKCVLLFGVSSLPCYAWFLTFYFSTWM